MNINISLQFRATSRHLDEDNDDKSKNSIMLSINMIRTYNYYYF